jgi:hypothetical protein
MKDGYWRGILLHGVALLSSILFLRLSLLPMPLFIFPPSLPPSLLPLLGSGLGDPRHRQLHHRGGDGPLLGPTFGEIRGFAAGTG